MSSKLGESLMPWWTAPFCRPTSFQWVSFFETSFDENSRCYINGQSRKAGSLDQANEWMALEWHRRGRQASPGLLLIICESEREWEYWALVLEFQNSRWFLAIFSTRSSFQSSIKQVWEDTPCLSQGLAHPCCTVHISSCAFSPKLGYFLILPIGLPWGFLQPS